MCYRMCIGDNMSSNAWNMNGYQYDGSGYNYDAYEVTSFENEQAAFMGVCALANQSGNVVSGLGNVNVGSVQNVSLDGVNSHKACLSGMGSTLDSTMNRMGNALNARFKAEVEAGHLFGDKELPEDFDFAAYLKDMAKEKTSEILSAFSNAEAGTSFGEDFDPKTMLSQNWESLKQSNPEAYKTQMDALYELAKGKDPSEWTMDELYASCSRLDELQAKYDEAKARRDEAANWGGYDSEADYEMSKCKKEMKAIEADLKQIGVMEYSSWEKGWIDIKNATKALWNEGKDVVSALGQRDFKGAWQEAKEFGSQALATNAVVGESVVSGVSKINEWVQDGLVMVGATLATPTTYVADALFRTDITGNLWDGTMDFVAEDRVGNAREWFYNTAVGQAINNASQLKWNSDGSTMIQNVSRKAGEITAAAAITLATGGTAAPLAAAGIGFLEGTGQEGERRFSMTDENGNYTNRGAIDLALAYLSGVGKGAEWYMYGDVVAGLAKGGVAAAAESLTGHSGKDALINMAKKADVYVDTAAAFAQGVTTRLNTGKWNFAELGLDLAFSILGNYGGEYLNAVAGNRAAREAAQSAARHADDLISGSPTDKIDDLFRHTDDIDVPGTTVPGAEYVDNAARQGDEIVTAAAKEGDDVDNVFKEAGDEVEETVDAAQVQTRPAAQPAVPPASSGPDYEKLAADHGFYTSDGTKIEVSITSDGKVPEDRYLDHLFNGEGVKKKEVKGAHTDTAFYKTLDDDSNEMGRWCITNTEKTSNGLIEFEYGYPAKTREGVIIPGQLKAERMKKTVFDTSVYSEDDIKRMCREAVDDFLNNKNIVMSNGKNHKFIAYSKNGIKFEGWIDRVTGEIASLYPVIN